MKTYQVASRTDYLKIGAFCVLVGLTFLSTSTLWSLGLIVVNDHARPTSQKDLAWVGAAFLAGCVCCYFGWQFLARYPYRIAVTGDGTIDLRRVLGATMIRASEIRSVEQKIAWFGSEDDDRRLICLRLDHGAVTIRYFAEAPEFLAEVVQRARCPSRPICP